MQNWVNLDCLRNMLNDRIGKSIIVSISKAFMHEVSTLTKTHCCKLCAYMNV